jgi:Na+-transporting NADH:ubiquinone oxidoreductase subunit F
VSEILVGVALFTAVAMALVATVLAARAWLASGGAATLVVNEERVVTAARGEKLLGALHAAGILLPGSCGGKGTCGQCRITVLRGAGPVLPTESSRLSRAELALGRRLACQVTVRGDLELRVPDEIFGVQRWSSRVRSARCVATFIKEIVLELPEGESLGVPAGRYVEVTCPAYRLSYRDLAIDASVRADWDRLDLWRFTAAASVPTTRAYSLANSPEQRDVAVLLVRIATPPPAVPDAPPGIVSSWLFSLRPGDPVPLSGPHGHIALDPGEHELVLVGGGAGMAPVRAHLLDQLLRLKSPRRLRFFYGARSLRELFYADDFDRLAALHPNFSWTVALSEPRAEDAWQGETGFVHEVLRRRHLEPHPAPETCEYYLCGPPLMVKAVRSVLDEFGVDPERIRTDDFGA